MRRTLLLNDNGPRVSSSGGPRLARPAVARKPSPDEAAARRDDKPRANVPARIAGAAGRNAADCPRARQGDANLEVLARAPAQCPQVASGLAASRARPETAHRPARRRSGRATLVCGIAITPPRGCVRRARRCIQRTANASAANATGFHLPYLVTPCFRAGAPRAPRSRPPCLLISVGRKRCIPRDRARHAGPRYERLERAARVPG